MIKPTFKSRKELIEYVLGTAHRVDGSIKIVKIKRPKCADTFSTHALVSFRRPKFRYELYINDSNFLLPYHLQIAEIKEIWDRADEGALLQPANWGPTRAG